MDLCDCQFQNRCEMYMSHTEHHNGYNCSMKMIKLYGICLLFMQVLRRIICRIGSYGNRDKDRRKDKQDRQDRHTDKTRQKQAGSLTPFTYSWEISTLEGIALVYLCQGRDRRGEEEEEEETLIRKSKHSLHKQTNTKADIHREKTAVEIQTVLTDCLNREKAKSRRR